MKKTIIFCFLILSIVSDSFAAGTVSFESLMKDMANRSSICEFPSPGYACRQFSSFDRGSKAADQPGWFANGDSSKFLRTEKNAAANGRDEWVLMDAQGPGAVVRFWITAGHYKNNLYIYIDGNPEPVIAGNIADIIGGTQLVEGVLSAETARGRNLYLPIPYAKSIKITCDQMPLQGCLYYQINYRTYESTAQVESLNKTILTESKPFVQQIQERLGGAVEGDFVETLPDGGNRIDAFAVRIESADLASALRNTVVKMTFDGNQTVWAPLGDFFGSGVGANPYKTVYTIVEANEQRTVAELVSRWPMPYRKTAKVEFEKLNPNVNAQIRASYKVKPYEWNENSLYFHADWRQERKIQTVAGNGTKDWNYATIVGKGVFVGDCLSVLNRDPAWWGEGDEKIYVDGEKFPSHFGTGTEDYYGYAWCTPQFFESPFRAQPRAEGPGNFGNTTNLRFRALDAIPFTADFRFDMEVWHWKATEIDYAVATFWYGTASSKDVALPPLNKRIEEASAPVEYKTKLDLKTDTFEVVGLPSGQVSFQGMGSFKLGKWREDRQIWWTGGKPGDQMELRVKLENSEAKSVALGLTCAVDYGIFEFFWDGKKIGGLNDLYVPKESGVIHKTLEISLDGANVKSGEHVLTVRLVGKTRDSIGTMFGLDFVEAK